MLQTSPTNLEGKFTFEITVRKTIPTNPVSVQDANKELFEEAIKVLRERPGMLRCIKAEVHSDIPMGLGKPEDA